MVELHPEFITKDGQKELAVLPYEYFLKIQQLLEDLKDLRDAKQEERDVLSVSLNEVKNVKNKKRIIIFSV